MSSVSSEQINSAADLEALREKVVAARQKYRARVLMCATGCRALGAMEVGEALKSKIQESGLAGDVQVVHTGCIGMCAWAPVMLIEPYDYIYGRVGPDDVDAIIEQTLRQGKCIERLTIKENGRAVCRAGDLSFYKKQKRVVLENCGRIDPRSIEDSIERAGYSAALGVLTEKSPDQVIEEIIESGLRGRGGGGFATGIKWRLCRQAPGNEKYLICNADEGDPGAFMDRALLEGDPHRILEGMIIAAYAIGATRGFIYVRAEYPIAVEHINIALDQARRLGLLGTKIAGTDFDFDIEVRMGAGAFVCGEETALIASLEGKRGMPRPRPPFPAQSGYHGKPTNINNVETLANVTAVFKHGVQWYKSIGTEDSKGTKIFALAGRVNNTGLVEVPMGTTIRQLVFDIGGGIPKGRKFKAVQTGGPSGGCLPAQFLDLPVDYASLAKAGAIMGSGGLIVMDENTCAVDLAKFFLQFVQSESCGKCTPCRVGTKKMLEILERISAGKGELSDLDRLEHLGNQIKKASLCGLGRTAPNPVLSTLKYFRSEYEEHILFGHCRGARCEELVAAPCEHTCPAGIDVPDYVSLVEQQRLDEAIDVVRRRNPFVSVCGRVCHHPCETKCRRAEVDEPISIMALKRYIADNAQRFDRLTAPPATGTAQVAIVGAGPAGLACAYFLALMQRPSVIFEAQPVPGGMLELAIPEYRLPKELLKKEIDFILAHGIDLRTNSEVEDVRELLNQGFKAVLVATGAQTGRKLKIPGENLPAVLDGLVVLRDIALGRPGRFKGQKVIVIGGGNAAVDVARSVLRLGAENVTILYRRSEDQMPAYREEIEQALNEGVKLQTLAIPKRFLGNAKVTSVEVLSATLDTAGADGRRRPVPIENSERCVECDSVIVAVGQVPSTELLAYRDGPALVGAGTVKVNPVTMAASVSPVFAAGDCVSGPATVVEAVAAGQRAAVNIDRSLGGPGRLPPQAKMTFTRPDEETLRSCTTRATARHLPLAQRANSFREVVLGLDRNQVVTEARRCLRCDLEE